MKWNKKNILPATMIAISIIVLLINSNNSMLNLFKNIFQTENNTNFRKLIQEGAIIVDVRTTGEFNSGHIEGSINIPLDSLTSNLGRLPKTKTIIACCASGMRSASAKQILESKGYDKVYNGQGWAKLQRALME